VQGDVNVHEDWGHLNIMLTEAVQHDRGAVSKPLGQIPNFGLYSAINLWFSNCEM